MAGFTLPGQVPYNGVSGPSDFAVAQNAALRKRKMAEMLQAQAFKPNEVGLVPGSKMSWANPLAALLNSYVSNKLDKESDTEEAAANKSAQEGLDNAIANMPRPTEAVPAKPIEQEQVGPGPIAPQAGPDPLAAAFGPGGMPGAGVPPKDNEFKGSGSEMAAQLLGGAPPTPPLAPEGPSGPPLLPQKMDMAGPGMLPKLATDAIPAKSVPPEEMFKFAAGLSKFGPQGAELGKELRAGAAKEMTMIPKADIDPYTVAGSSVFNKKTGKWEEASPETKARMDETRAKNIEANTTKNRELDIKESLGEERNAVLAMIKSRGNSEGSGGKAHTVGRAADGSGRVVETSNGDRELIKADGTRVKNYTGETVPLTTVEKEIQKATDARAHLVDATDLLSDVKRDPKAYGTAAAVGSGIPVVGKWIAKEALTAEQRQTRAAVQTQMSETTKRIFGSAFTAPEMARAEQYIVMKDDPWEVAVDKLENMQKMAQKAMDKKSTVGVKGSEARAPMTGTAAAKPDASRKAAMDAYGLK